EGAKDVAEEDAEDDEPEPRGNEDEGDREVAVRSFGAVQPGPDRDPQQEHAERLGEHLRHAVDEQRRDPRPGWAPMGLLEARRVPGDREPEERDDEDQRGSPGEQPRRNREVL